MFSDSDLDDMTQYASGDDIRVLVYFIDFYNHTFDLKLTIEEKDDVCKLAVDNLILYNRIKKSKRCDVAQRELFEGRVLFPIRDKLVQIKIKKTKQENAK